MNKVNKQRDDSSIQETYWTNDAETQKKNINKQIKQQINHNLIYNIIIIKRSYLIRIVQRHAGGCCVPRPSFDGALAL